MLKKICSWFKEEDEIKPGDKSKPYYYTLYFDIKCSLAQDILNDLYYVYRYSDGQKMNQRPWPKRYAIMMVKDLLAADKYQEERALATERLEREVAKDDMFKKEGTVANTVLRHDKEIKELQKNTQHQIRAGAGLDYLKSLQTIKDDDEMVMNGYNLVAKSSLDSPGAAKWLSIKEYSDMGPVFKSDTVKSLEEKMKDHLIKHYFVEKNMKQIDIKVDIASTIVSPYSKEPMAPFVQTIVFDVKRSRNNMDLKIKSVSYTHENLSLLLRADGPSRSAAMNHPNLVLKELSELGSPKHAAFADRIDKEIASQFQFNRINPVEEPKKPAYNRGFEYIKW